MTAPLAYTNFDARADSGETAYSIRSKMMASILRFLCLLNCSDLAANKACSSKIKLLYNQNQSTHEVQRW